MTALYAGLDVSLELTSLCVVDEEGRIIREAKVASEPDAIDRELGSTLGDYLRVGLEAGPLSQWLCFRLLRCIELPEAMAEWSLTSLQLKLIEIGARVVRHARAIRSN